MTEAESITYLKKSFHIRTDNKDLVLLHAMKAMLQRADDEDRKKIGMLVVGFAGLHKLKNGQLLRFFDTTMKKVRIYNSDEQLQLYGLYRILVTCPFLSETSELFFGAWLAASYEDNPFKCMIRRVGNDAFRIVSILPGNDGEVEFPEDVTMEQAAELTNCPMDDLQSMRVLQ